MIPNYAIKICLLSALIFCVFAIIAVVLGIWNMYGVKGLALLGFLCSLSLIVLGLITCFGALFDIFLEKSMKKLKGEYIYLCNSN